MRTPGGEDAAAFEPSAQSTAKWTFFTAELAVVLGIMYWVSCCSGTYCLSSLAPLLSIAQAR